MNSEPYPNHFLIQEKLILIIPEKKFSDNLILEKEQLYRIIGETDLSTAQFHFLFIINFVYGYLLINFANDLPNSSPYDTPMDTKY